MKFSGILLTALLLFFAFLGKSQDWISYEPDLPNKDNIEYLKLDDVVVGRLPNLMEFKNLKGLHIEKVNGQIHSLLGLDKLSQLTTLNLINIDFSSAQDVLLDVCSLKKLERLHISDIKGIGYLPKQFTKLKSLKYLGLERVSSEFNSNNNFELISQLRSLEELNIQGNLWKTFDGDLMCFINHPAMQTIRIDKNCTFKSYVVRIQNKLTTIKIINKVNC